MPIRPKIKIEQVSVCKEDFEAVAGLLYFGNTDELDVTDTWNTHLLMPPTTFFELLTQDIPGKPFVMVTSVSSGLISIQQSAKCEQKGDLFTSKRNIDLNSNYVDSGVLDITWQGDSIGKVYLRNYIELGIYLGCEGFKVYASDKNGAYFWAKAGVPLQEESEVINHNKLRKVLSGRLEAVRDFIDPDVYNEVSKLIELNSIYDVNTIAGLDTPISQNIYFRYTDGDIVNDAEEERLRKLIEFCADNEKEFTLGRYLLNGATYRGYLSFDDSIAMPRIEKYVGGFKTIELVETEGAPQHTASAKKAALSV